MDETALLSTLSALVGVVGFLVEATRMHRARRGAIRPVIGWTVAVLGIIIAASVAWSVPAQHLPLGASRGLGMTVIAIVGLALTALGATYAVLSPSMDRGDVRALLAAVERRIRQSEQGDRFDPRWYVELGVRRTGDRLPKRLSMSMLPTGTATFLCGGAGTGKTTALRRFALDQCSQSIRSRRPRDLVAYVEVRLLGDPRTITVGTVRSHLVTATDSDDPQIGDKVARYLDEPSGRYRWLFVFDVGDELGSTDSFKYVQAIAQFMRSRHRDRAVVAFRVRPAGVDSVLTMGGLSTRRVHALLRRHGVAGPVQVELRNRLMLDADFADLRIDVGLLSRLAAYWANTVYRRDSRFEILDAFLASQFSRDNALGDEPSVAIGMAQDIAYRLLVDQWQICPPAETAALAMANLGRHEGRWFRFRSAVVQQHLAAHHMLRTGLPVDLGGFLDRSDRRAALVALLRGGRGQRATALTERLGQLLGHHSPRRQEETDVEDGPHLVPGEFRWSLEQLHCLIVLREGLSHQHVATLPADVRSAIDQTVKLAILAGGDSARRNGIRLLPLATANVQVPLFEKLLGFRTGIEIRRLAVAQIGMCGNILGRFTPPVRLKILFTMAVSGLVTTVVESIEYTRQAPAEAARIATDLTRLVRYTAWGIVVYTFALQANKGGPNGVALVLGLLAITYLVMSSRLVRHPEFDEYLRIVERALVWATIGLGALSVFSASIGVVVNAVHADGNTILAIVQLWLITWPVAVLVLIAGARDDPISWWLPQRQAFGVARRDLLPLQLRSKIRDRLDYLLSWRRAVAALAVSGLAVAAGIVATLDLRLADDTEATVDALVWAPVIVFGAMVLSRPRNRTPSDWRSFERLANEGADVDRLLDILDSTFRRGRRTVLRFLTSAAAAEPGRLRGALPLVSDLERLLAFLSSTLPDKSEDVIKEAMWQLAPSFDTPRFRSWAMTFDKEYKGFLIRLAASRRERSLISRTIENAQHTSPVPAGSGVE